MIQHIKSPLLHIEYLENIYQYNKKFLYSQKLPDTICYCLIKHLQWNYLSISLYIKKNPHTVQMITFKAKSAEVLCRLIGLHEKIADILSVTHTLYIGMELMKAEVAMVTGQNYIQN